MHKPDLLENVEARHEKKFLKVANKIINMYLKRQDLFIFHVPVDTNTYIDYLDHVERPMDFSTIKTKLQFNCYETEDEFKNDILLVYDNCIKYNGAESPLGKIADQLKYDFIDTFKKESISI